MPKRFNADYWESPDSNFLKIGDHDRQLVDARARRQRLIAVIERRIGAPPLKDRSWYRITEIVAHSVPDGNPPERIRLFRSFASSLQAGIFDGGKLHRSQVFFAQPDPRFGFRLTDDFLTNRLKIFEADQREEMLERLLGTCWIPRNYVVPWLARTKSRVPEWLAAETKVIHRRGNNNLAENSVIHRVSRAPHPSPVIDSNAGSTPVAARIGGSYARLKRNFPGLSEAMVGAAISINEGSGSPIDAAKVLWDLRASPHILTRVFSLPRTALADQTCTLMNLEDELFQMVINGEFPLSYAIVVGLAAPHNGKLQSDLFALLMEKKPGDENAKSIVGRAMEDWAEAASQEQKRQRAERTFLNPYWRTGAVLSWIAYRDRNLICHFEDRRDWGTAKWYNGGGTPWKVDHPDVELIRALQDGRLRASRQKSHELPVELPPIFLGAERRQGPFHDRRRLLARPSLGTVASRPGRWSA